MNEEGFDSTNINPLWLRNIYENLHNLEELERLSREGVPNLVEYANIPEQEREKTIAYLQYKNLRSMVSEMYLLLTDLVPVIKKDFYDQKKLFLDKLRKKINQKEFFIHAPVNQKLKKVISVKLKPIFDDTVDIMCLMRKDIIEEIASLLYVKQEEE